MKPHSSTRPDPNPDAGISGETRRHGGESWQKNLPDEWRAAVDAPIYCHNYREYEMAAARTIGYDEADHPCYINHHFVITRLSSDDDEAYYEAVMFCEEMSAWRLRDQRWLIFRTTSNNPTSAPRGFYVVSPDMPR